MKKRVALVVVYLIALGVWCWYKRHTSPWRQIPSSQLDQILSQMRYGKQEPLDTTLVMADVNAWLRGL